MNHQMEGKAIRARIRQACDTCRIKKRKCDGSRPLCTVCADLRVTCTYSPLEKKRGVRSGLLHELERKCQLYESLLGKLVMREQAAGGKQVKMEALVKEYSNENGSPQWEEIADLQKTWDLSIIRSKFEKATRTYEGARPKPKSMSSLMSNNEISSRVINLFGVNAMVPRDGNNSASTWEPKALEFPELTGSISGFTPMGIKNFNSELGPDFPSPFRVGSFCHLYKASLSIPPTELIEFPPDFAETFNSYFHCIHMWLPMVNRDYLLKFIGRFNEMADQPDPLINGSLDYSTVGLLWIITALGRYFVDLGANQVDILTSRKFANNAMTSLRYSVSTTLETIQTLLLVGYYYYLIGEWDQAWVILSSSSRMAIDVRLIKKDPEVSNLVSHSTSAPDTWDMRTWGGALILNTLISARLGRQTVIRSADWPRITIPVDGWEESAPWSETTGKNERDNLFVENSRCLTTFNCVLKVVTTLNLALTSNFDTVGVHDGLFASSVITFDYLESQMKQMEEMFPSYLKLYGVRSIDEGVLPPHFIFPCMLYNMALIITALRMSHVAKEEAYQYTRLQRDRCYSKGVNGLMDILKFQSRLVLSRIPFLDYFITICLCGPSMLASQGVSVTSVTLFNMKLLGYTSKFSRSCEIANRIIQFQENERRKSNESGATGPSSVLNEFRVGSIIGDQNFHNFPTTYQSKQV